MDGRNQSTFRSLVIIGIVVSLSLAFGEMSLRMAFSFSPFTAPVILCNLLAVTTVAILALYTVILVASIPVARILKFDLRRLALGVAVWVAVFVTVDELTEIVGLARSWGRLVVVALVVAISVMASVPTTVALRTLDRRLRARDCAALLARSLPLGLAAVFALLWACRSLLVAVGSVQFVAAMGAIGLIAACLLALAFPVCRQMILSRGPGVLLVVVLLSPFAASCGDWMFVRSVHRAANPRTRAPQVILITVDTLRADALSCYKPSAVGTPHLDALAEDGVLFTNAFAPAPWTLPSVASLLTGLSPSVHLTTGPESILSDGVRTLAEHLRDAGYLTAAMGWNVILNRRRQLSQGFAIYDFYPRYPMHSVGARVMSLLDPSVGDSDRFSERLTRQAIRFLEDHHDRSFFLWLHYFTPHIPYAPPTDFLPSGTVPESIGVRFAAAKKIRGGYLTLSTVEREWVRQLYDAEVRFVDTQVGQVLDALKRLDQYDDCLIVFTSDHGDEFWEHGGFEHGHTLYNELLKVPLIVRLPQPQSESTIGNRLTAVSTGRIEERVSIESVMPTILDLCGIAHTPDAASAQSLRPLWGDDPHRYQAKPIIGTSPGYY